MAGVDSESARPSRSFVNCPFEPTRTFALPYAFPCAGPERWAKVSGGASTDFAARIVAQSSPRDRLEPVIAIRLHTSWATDRTSIPLMTHVR